MLKDKDIKQIYDSYVAVNYTDSYRKKYEPLPLSLNNKKWKWEEKAFVRVISLLEFREYMIEYTFDNVLSFNGNNDPEYEYLKYTNCYNYNYTDNVEKYNLHNLELDRNDFDFVMLNYTIEHLYDPIRAVKNIYKYMKIGGIIYVSAPVVSVSHSTPFHFYTGFTPTGLGVIMKLAGFDILKIGQWGNLEYYRQEIVCAWPDYTYSKNPGLNDFDYPHSTWCLAIKN